MCFTGGGGGSGGGGVPTSEGKEEEVVDAQLARHAAAEVIPAERSAWSVSMHGEDTPFRHWTVMRRYVEGLFARGGYGGRLVSYGTSVERAEKTGEEWVLTLRREEVVGEGEGKSVTDVWTQERFDAVVVASGHFNVPWIPPVEGLDEFERRWPGSVLHSKMFRGRDDYRGKVGIPRSRVLSFSLFPPSHADQRPPPPQRVVVVGASVSGADIAYDLATHRATRDGGVVHAIVEGHTFNGYFGDEAFRHPLIRRHPSIARVDPLTRTVHLVDGAGAIPDVDRIIFGTGYSWSLPFLADAGDAGRVAVRNNRVPGLYQHVVWREDPSLLFVGAVGAGLTFKIFEWQAVYAARLLAGRGRLPAREDMARWEEDRVRQKGDGPAFQMVYPDFEEYFETLRALAGEPTDKGEGRRLPRFDDAWFRAFMEGHERRKAMWRRLNQEAREQLEKEKGVAAQSQL